MTKKQHVNLIVKTAKAERLKGLSVDINFSIPTLSIGSLFLQGEEAQTVIENAVNIVNEFQCSIEDYLLYFYS